MSNTDVKPHLKNLSPLKYSPKNFAVFRTNTRLSVYPFDCPPARQLSVTLRVFHALCISKTSYAWVCSPAKLRCLQLQISGYPHTSLFCSTLLTAKDTEKDGLEAIHFKFMEPLLSGLRWRRQMNYGL